MPLASGGSWGLGDQEEDLGELTPTITSSRRKNIQKKEEVVDVAKERVRNLR